MVEQQLIDDLAKRIAQEFEPEQIILFGSHAHGNPNRDSDVDLLVIMPFEGKGTRKAVEILNRVNPRIPLDLVVRTPEEVQRRLDLNDFFLREILERGRVLYESAHV